MSQNLQNSKEQFQFQNGVYSKRTDEGLGDCWINLDLTTRSMILDIREW